METKLTSQIDEYAEKLIGIVRKLPPERVLQLVDFARFLEAQTTERYDAVLAGEAESEEEIRASQAKWDELLSQPEARRVMREMAREALEDYRTGQTTDITITDDDRLAPA
jgi:hypothetical protein